MEARRALGLVLTVLGLLLFIYGFVVGGLRGEIGSKEMWTSDAASIIAGWFLLIVGPALYFGGAPTAVEKAVMKQR
ncbi:MAG: hypothetical protein ABWW70_01420 [Thermoproteota archaeon]